MFEIVRDFPHWVPTPDAFYQLDELSQLELYWFNVISEEMVTRDEIERMESSKPKQASDSASKIPRKRKAL